MLAHADSEGWVDVHPKAIAEETGLTIEQVNAAIKELESPDPDSRSPEEEGRRIVLLNEHRSWGWRVVNHGKYRAIRSEEDRREANRIAQQKFRDKNKPPVSNSNQPVIQRKHPSAESAQAEAETDTKAGKPKTIGNVSVAILLSEGVSEECANELLSLRKRKKAALTPLAWTGLKNDITKAGYSLNDGIAIMSKKNWASFDGSWLNNGSNHGNGKQTKFDQLAATAAALTGGSQRTFDSATGRMD